MTIRQVHTDLDSSVLFHKILQMFFLRPVVVVAVVVVVVVVVAVVVLVLVLVVVFVCCRDTEDY